MISFPPSKDESKHPSIVKNGVNGKSEDGDAPAKIDPNMTTVTYAAEDEKKKEVENEATEKGDDEEKKPLKEDE